MPFFAIAFTEFTLSEKQAEAILDIHLRKLTVFEVWMNISINQVHCFLV